jgi:hypothetical protein
MTTPEIAMGPLFGDERSEIPLRVVHVRTANKKYSVEYFIDEEGEYHEVPQRPKE